MCFGFFEAERPKLYNVKKHNYFLKFSAFMALFFSATWLFGQTYTFTPCGATGGAGPSQAMADAAYLTTTLDGQVEVIGGIQYWIVPTSGNYRIETYGGQGYGPFGGRGAQMIGDFFLNAGDTLKILVGQKAADYYQYPATTYNHQFGGGGGSFVTMPDNTPLIVAGGGGGNHGVDYVLTCDGQITTDGASGANGSTVSAGGVAGAGGLTASSADGGGGFFGNGTGTAAGTAFVSGGAGGGLYGFGGFGGGGGTSSWNNYRGGGGGGYSGGGAGNNGGTCCPCGGGGGSYNIGANQDNLSGVQIGDGMVVINNLCAPTVLNADVASLPDLTDECSVAVPTFPTASNDCNTTIDGVPDVSFPVTTPGTTVVTWTYNDGFTTITQTQNVIIADVTGPTPDMASLPDSTYWCSVESLIQPTATDNCGGAVSVTNDVTLPITTGGLTVITWTYTDMAGNTTTQTQNITLDVIGSGIAQMGTMLYATTPGYMYQWLDCDNGYAIIPGEINQFYTPADSGNFAVQVTYNGCVDTSACMSYGFAGLDEVKLNNLLLYPNPSADGQFVVAADGMLEDIRVYDVAGRSVEVATDLENGAVNGSALDPGKYMVRVTVNGKVYLSTLVIMK